MMNIRGMELYLKQVTSILRTKAGVDFHSKQTGTKPNSQFKIQMNSLSRWTQVWVWLVHPQSWRLFVDKTEDPELNPAEMMCVKKKHCLTVQLTWTFTFSFQSTKKTCVPVLNATDVKLYLIPATHNALLDVHEVRRLVVDEDEAHAALEGHYGV